MRHSSSSSILQKERRSFPKKIYARPAFLYLMTKQTSSLYTNFPVHETIDITDLSDIPNAVDNMVKAYAYLNERGEFSYRLLLPRGEKSLTIKAKKIGFVLQAELLLALKNNKLKVNLKEIRYVHDENHYGWLLFNPAMHERYFSNNNVVDY